MISNITYSDIFPIWKNYLWKDRIDIKNMSSMLYNGGYDLKIYELYEPFFIAYIKDNKILGVNSGHKTSNYHFRSRGLYVFPEYRKKGIGVKLLNATLDLAKTNNCKICWSVPRKLALSTYISSGFIRVSDFIATDTSPENCYVSANLYV